MRIALTANGPGEVAGWVRPLRAAALRARSRSRRARLSRPRRLRHRLRSAMLARALFPAAHVYDPKTYVKFALGGSARGRAEERGRRAVPRRRFDACGAPARALARAARRPISSRANGYRELFDRAFAVDEKQRASSCSRGARRRERIVRVGNLAIDGALLEAQAPLETGRAAGRHPDHARLARLRGREPDPVLLYDRRCASRASGPTIPIAFGISPFTPHRRRARGDRARRRPARLRAARRRLVEEGGARLTSSRATAPCAFRCCATRWRRRSRARLVADDAGNEVHRARGARHARRSRSRRSTRPSSIDVQRPAHVSRPAFRWSACRSSARWRSASRDRFRLPHAAEHGRERDGDLRTARNAHARARRARRARALRRRGVARPTGARLPRSTASTPARPTGWPNRSSSSPGRKRRCASPSSSPPKTAPPTWSARSRSLASADRRALVRDRSSSTTARPTGRSAVVEAAARAGRRAGALRVRAANPIAARRAIAASPPATGYLVLFCDDDVQAPPGFIAAHEAAHDDAANLVVNGPILNVPSYEDRPKPALANYSRAFLCTCNVSVPRARARSRSAGSTRRSISTAGKIPNSACVCAKRVCAGGLPGTPTSGTSSRRPRTRSRSRRARRSNARAWRARFLAQAAVARARAWRPAPIARNSAAREVPASRAAARDLTPASRRATRAGVAARRSRERSFSTACTPRAGAHARAERRTRERTRAALLRGRRYRRLAGRVASSRARCARASTAWMRLTLPGHRATLERVPDSTTCSWTTAATRRALAARFARARATIACVVTWATARTARVPQLGGDSAARRTGAASLLVSLYQARGRAQRARRRDLALGRNSARLRARARLRHGRLRSAFRPHGCGRRRGGAGRSRRARRGGISCCCIRPTRSRPSAASGRLQGWAALARALAERFGTLVALSGTKADEGIVREILALAERFAVRSVAGVTGIGGFGALAQRAQSVRRHHDGSDARRGRRRRADRRHLSVSERIFPSAGGRAARARPSFARPIRASGRDQRDAAPITLASRTSTSTGIVAPTAALIESEVVRL